MADSNGHTLKCNDQNSEFIPPPTPRGWRAENSAPGSVASAVSKSHPGGGGVQIDN